VHAESVLGAVSSLVRGGWELELELLLQGCRCDCAGHVPLPSNLREHIV
jgi:hypothetical protein